MIQIRMTKTKKFRKLKFWFKTFGTLEHSGFGFVSYFVFRISDFRHELRYKAHKLVLFRIVEVNQSLR